MGRETWIVLANGGKEQRLKRGDNNAEHKREAKDTRYFVDLPTDLAVAITVV